MLGSGQGGGDRVGTGGWGLGELGLDLGRGLCCSIQLTLLISRPLGFGVGTRGWGQGLGELGLDLGRGLRCSIQLILLIGRPLGFGVGTRGEGTHLRTQI